MTTLARSHCILRSGSQVTVIVWLSHHMGSSNTTSGSEKWKVLPLTLMACPQMRTVSCQVLLRIMIFCQGSPQGGGRGGRMLVREEEQTEDDEKERGGRTGKFRRKNQSWARMKCLCLRKVDKRRNQKSKSEKQLKKILLSHGIWPSIFILTRSTAVLLVCSCCSICTTCATYNQSGSPLPKKQKGLLAFINDLQVNIVQGSGVRQVYIFKSIPCGASHLSGRNKKDEAVCIFLLQRTKGYLMQPECVL